MTNEGFSQRKTKEPDQPQEQRTFQPPEILAGEGAESFLVPAIPSFEFKSGDRLLAGTDKGIGYKDHNEDRVVIVEKENFVAVVDGMGGESQGEKAAQILAESLLASPNDPTQATKIARQKMKESDLFEKEGGACFMAAKVLDTQNGKVLQISRIGDCSLFVMKKDGTIVYKSPEDSLISLLVDIGIITKDQALYHDLRAIILQAVNIAPNVKPENMLRSLVKNGYLTPEQEEDEKIKDAFTWALRARQEPSFSEVLIEQGDLVVIASDGIIPDNFTPEEISMERPDEGWSPEGLFSWLSEATTERMKKFETIKESSSRKKEGKYSDGYKTKPKRDNRALAILQVT